VNLNANFNILKQFNCALVGRIKDLGAFRISLNKKQNQLLEKTLA
jgi:hypothetical protein